jgi:hypothetical protein
MAKKSFIGGLDNLLASAGIKKKAEVKEIEKPVDVNQEKPEITEDEKHWLLIKMDRLNEELQLWRSGQLNVSDFHESLKKFGLRYDQKLNQIVEE